MLESRRPVPCGRSATWSLLRRLLGRVGRVLERAEDLLGEQPPHHEAEGGASLDPGRLRTAAELEGRDEYGREQGQEEGEVQDGVQDLAEHGTPRKHNGHNHW